jgi:hypothetical protein
MLLTAAASQRAGSWPTGAKATETAALIEPERIFVRNAVAQAAQCDSWPTTAGSRGTVCEMGLTP